MENNVTEVIQNATNDPTLNKGFNIERFLNFEIGGFSIGNIIKAVIVLIIGLLIKKIVDNIVKKALSNTVGDKKTAGIIQRVVDIILVFLIAAITASTLGVNTASLIALASVLSLGIVLALNDMLGNLAGGIEIFASKIFKIDDFIRVDGVEGFVISISLTHTRIKTVDNHIISIPNKEISSKTVTNYFGEKTRRNPIVVTASYDSPTDIVEKALLEAAADEPEVLKDPKPFVCLTNYLESSIEYTLYFWTPSSNWWGPKMSVNRRIREKFAKYGAEMSYNHLNIHMIEKNDKEEQE